MVVHRASRRHRTFAKNIAKLSSMLKKHGPAKLRASSTARLLPFDAPLSAKNGQVSVLSQNVLHPSWNPILYKHPWIPEKAARWSNRCEKLKRVIRNADADIVCLQECGPDPSIPGHGLGSPRTFFSNSFEDLKSSMGYTMVRGCNAKNSNVGEKIMVWFKTRRYRKVWESHRTRIVILQLECLHRPGVVVFVLACHLSAHGDQNRFNEIRSALKHVRRRISQMKNKSDRIEIVMAGDMNSEPDDMVNRMITEGLEKDHGFGPFGAFKPEYDFLEASAQFEERPLTFVPAPGHGRTIDFIYHTKGLKLNALRPSMSPEMVRRALLTGMPNLENGSDHAPVSCLFDL